MVRRWSTSPYEFVCLSNHEFVIDGVTVLPLLHDWQGWWSKIEIFRADLPFKYDRVLYLDLDLVILQEIDFFVMNGHGNRMMISPAQTKDKGNPRMSHGYNSSVMSFNTGTMSEIYDAFKEAPEYFMANYRSDQDYLKRFWSDFTKYPPEWIRKLGAFIDRRTGKLDQIPEDVKILLAMPLKNMIASKRFPEFRKLWK